MCGYAHKIRHKCMTILHYDFFVLFAKFMIANTDRMIIGYEIKRQYGNEQYQYKSEYFDYDLFSVCIHIILPFQLALRNDAPIQCAFWQLRDGVFYFSKQFVPGSEKGSRKAFLPPPSRLWEFPVHCPAENSL